MELSSSTSLLLEIIQKVEIPWILRCRLNDLIYKSFSSFSLSFTKYSVFQENNHKESMQVDTEMKNAQI